MQVLKYPKLSIKYAAALAGILVLIKIIESKIITDSNYQSGYIALLTTLFLIAGIWVGSKFNEAKPALLNSEVSNRSQLKSNTANLSNRELEVLRFIEQGFSNQDIADRLFVSLNTVKTHISNLFVKLEVKSRIQAINKAKDLKII
jgi:DNA-binding CsgD family transcriptional regulator